MEHSPNSQQAGPERDWRRQDVHVEDTPTAAAPRWSSGKTTGNGSTARCATPAHRTLGVRMVVRGGAGRHGPPAAETGSCRPTRRPSPRSRPTAPGSPPPTATPASPTRPVIPAAVRSWRGWPAAAPAAAAARSPPWTGGRRSGCSARRAGRHRRGPARRRAALAHVRCPVADQRGFRRRRRRCRAHGRWLRHPDGAAQQDRPGGARPCPLSRRRHRRPDRRLLDRAGHGAGRSVPPRPAWWPSGAVARFRYGDTKL